MKNLYTLHQGNIWGSDKISEKEFFKAIGLKEGSNVDLNQAWNLGEKFRTRAQNYVQNKIANKVANFDMIIYAVVHKKGKAIAKHQIYCDLNLVNKNEEKKQKYFKLEKSFPFPKKLKKIFEEYRIALQKEFAKQKKGDKILKGKNEKSLSKFEEKVINYVNQYYPLLKKILLNDKNEKKRADAAWLLLWGNTKDIPDILFKVLLKDSSYIVCNNAGHSLLWILKKGKIKLKARPIYNLLKRQSTICRNKGAYLLLELIKQNSQIKIPQNMRKILVKMAHSKQPNNSDPARKILSKIK